MFIIAKMLEYYPPQPFYINWQALDASLYSWVGGQRTKYWEGRLKEDRREKLEALGFDFVFEPPKEVDNTCSMMGREHSKWEANFSELQDHVNTRGHVNVKQVRVYIYGAQSCCSTSP